MNREEIYTFNNFVISYDKNIKDRSYLLISKIAKTNIYILGELYDEGADIVNTIINELKQENKQLKDNWNKIEQIIENERMSHWAPSPLFLTELLSKMEELEKSDSNE